MKKILLAASLLMGVFAVKAQDLKAEAVVKVNTERHDFGKIKQGVPVTTYFELTNISDKPMILENVTASCGCTTPEYSKEPVMAGGTTKIKVGYNAASPARFDKDVYIKIAGVSEMKIVKISGDVLEAAAYETYLVESKKGKNTKSVSATKAPVNTKKAVAVKKSKPAAKTMK